MARSKTIRVTPNVKEALKQLTAAVKTMKEGNAKKNAEGALKYLSNTFKGGPQLKRGYNCPKETPLIK